MVAKAETEQNDYRRANKINVFFSPEKYHFSFGYFGNGIPMSVYFRNGAILLLSSAALLVALWKVLRIQLKKDGV
jgi:hypothetical protein